MGADAKSNKVLAREVAAALNKSDLFAREVQELFEQVGAAVS
jgi:hypothetical protein